MGQRTETEFDHEAYQELLGADALGVLSAAERRALTAHLATCETCRTELDQLRAAVHVLPLALDDRSPSPILRYRLQAALQRDLAESERGATLTSPPAPPPASRAAEPLLTPTPMKTRTPRRRVFVP